jgi:hypothetical protein
LQFKQQSLGTRETTETPKRSFTKSPIYTGSNEQADLELKLYTFIRKVLSSNLGRNIGYPDQESSWLSSVPQYFD